MAEPDRLAAALRYQQELEEAQRPATMNPNMAAQGQRMNLPARQVPGPVSAFGTQAMSLNPQPDQGYGTMAAEMALGFVPGIGQAMAARDIERARRDNDPIGMGMAASSFVPFGKLIGALRGGKQMGPVSQLDVYHGSPHKFDKFDASKIGTGEGAQAYGHGLYFAEARDVAKAYQPRDLANEEGLMRLYKQAERKQDYASMEVLENALLHKTPEELRSIHGAGGESVIRQIEKIPRTVGALYKVDLPDEQIPKMLDFNNPLKDQSPEIQKAMQDLVKTDVLGRPTGISVDPNMNGQWAYERLAGIRGAKYAAEAMREAGIPGIRYLDEGSRANFRVQNTVKGKPYGEPVSFMTERQAQEYAKEQAAKGFGTQTLPGTSNFVVFPGGEGQLNILGRE